MSKIYQNHIQDLKNLSISFGPAVYDISKNVLENPDFAVWSACVGNKHHYGKGGLQQHVWEVVTLCLNNRAFFGHIGCYIREDELFLAALFHDVGKLWDYEPNSDFTEWISTEHKRNIHHITRSAICWTTAVEHTGLYTDIKESVLHAILAHHGCREWGSPISPNSRVAWLLHLCDNLSARLDDVEKIDLGV